MEDYVEGLAPCFPSNDVCAYFLYRIYCFSDGIALP